MSVAVPGSAPRVVPQPVSRPLTQVAASGGRKIVETFSAGRLRIRPLPGRVTPAGAVTRAVHAARLIERRVSGLR